MENIKKMIAKDREEQAGRNNEETSVTKSRRIKRKFNELPSCFDKKKNGDESDVDCGVR